MQLYYLKKKKRNRYSHIICLLIDKSHTAVITKRADDWLRTGRAPVGPSEDKLY